MMDQPGPGAYRRLCACGASHVREPGGDDDDRGKPTAPLHSATQAGRSPHRAVAQHALRADIKARTLPAPVSLGPRAVGWIESDVQRWVADRIDAGWSGAATDGKGHRIGNGRRQE